MSIDVARARAQTPGCAARIHFNNCGAALMPTPVIDAFKGHIDLEAAIGDYEAAAAADERLEGTYAAVARLLNCAPDEVALAGRLRRRIEEIPGGRVMDKGSRRCAIVSFRIEGHAPAELVARLRERNMNLGVSSAPSTLLDISARQVGDLVRAGVHYYNTEDEVDACAAALAELTALR